MDGGIPLRKVQSEELFLGDRRRRRGKWSLPITDGGNQLDIVLH